MFLREGLFSDKLPRPTAHRNREQNWQKERSLSYLGPCDPFPKVSAYLPKHPTYCRVDGYVDAERCGVLEEAYNLYQQDANVGTLPDPRIQESL